MPQELTTQSKTLDNSRQDECMSCSSISDSDIMDEYIRRFTISDKAVTKKLQTALGAIDVDLLDHIIIGGMEYFSFSDHRLL